MGGYPRSHLKGKGLSRSRYNQIANFVLAQSEINIAIGGKPPEVYFGELAEQCNGSERKYGGITDMGQMRANLRRSCVPDCLRVRVPYGDEWGHAAIARSTGGLMLSLAGSDRAAISAAHA